MNRRTLTFDRMQSSYSQDTVFESLLSTDCQLDILGFHKPPVCDIMLHPVIVLCTRLLHARSPVSLAVIGSLESSRGIESSDEEEIVAECDNSQRVQPGDLAKISTIILISPSTNGWKPSLQLA